MSISGLPEERIFMLTVELWASSSAVDEDFTAKLIDVPEGYAMNLADVTLWIPCMPSESARCLSNHLLNKAGRKLYTLCLEVDISTCLIRYL